MAADLIKIITASVFALTLCTPLAVHSEALSDPTRPSSIAGGMGGEASAPAYRMQPQVRGLQSVIVSPTRCAAIINGKTIKLGDRHEGERLIEVNERGVVLQGERGPHTLNLFPSVAVKMTAAVSQDKPATRCQLQQFKDNKEPVTQAGPKEKR